MKLVLWIAFASLGVLLTLTFVGAIIGIPMMLFGAKRVSDVYLETTN